MISIYGVFADPSDVRHELDWFAGILPAQEMQLLADDEFAGSDSIGKTRHRVRCQPLDRPVERNEHHDWFDARGL